MAIDLDAIRARLERTGYNPWKDDTFALLDEVERLREYIDRMPYPSDMDQLRAERDRAEATLARVRAALTDHPRCDRHTGDDPMTCGWKQAVLDVQDAIERTDS